MLSNLTVNMVGEVNRGNMRYLIVITGEAPFLSNWAEIEMMPTDREWVLIDTKKVVFTKDLVHWHEVENDHL